MNFRDRIRHETSRDLRVTAVGLAHQLVKTAVASLERAALDDSDPDVARLFDEVDALVARFRTHHRELGDARVLRRGARLAMGARLAAGAQSGVPAAARAFSYVGAYFGAYSSLDAFARGALGFSERKRGWSDGTEQALDLHLRRNFWTVQRDGTLYAFRLAGDDPASEEERGRARVRRLLCAQFGDDAVDEALPTYAGHYRNLPEFVRSFLWELPFPTWILIHVDVYGLGYDWCLDGSIFTLAAGEGGMHVFVRRNPLSNWRYQIPV